MDYEKAYTDALERARNIRFGNPNSATANVVCEEIFPELAESEDERIREKLVEIIGYFRSRGIDQQLCEKFLVWLEKQDGTFTKKDVDDAYLKGICDAKLELEKQDKRKYVDTDTIKKKAHQIAWEISKHYDPNACKQEWCEMAALDIASWLKKQGEKANPYSGVSFEYNGHIWGMCARDNGVDISLDMQLFKHLEKQDEQKPAWSEEDEKILNIIIKDIQERHPESMWKINCGSTAAVSTKYIIDWLKSLKPQPRWKPTEEQIQTLKDTINHDAAYKRVDVLESLINDLKKL